MIADCLFIAIESYENSRKIRTQVKISVSLRFYVPVGEIKGIFSIVQS